MYKITEKNGQISYSENKNIIKEFPTGTLIEEIEKIPTETYTLTYKQKRQNEYPKIEDQLDMIYWDKVNNTSIWQTPSKKSKTNIQNKKGPYYSGFFLYIIVLSFA